MKIGVSIIIPTYREAENLPDLIAAIEPLRAHWPLELIIVDDDSQDGTREYLEKRPDWVKPIIRIRVRGLSTAVIEGFKHAEHPILVCMDADLSHPPSAIPEMVEALLKDDTDFVVGSRFIKGGKIDQRWSWKRKLNARIARLLAKPFTNIQDPMSGFFCLRKSTLKKADHLNPIGYKIGLELIVKCHCQHIAEIPIYFNERQKGQSKLNLKEMSYYLHHLFRLIKYKLWKN